MVDSFKILIYRKKPEEEPRYERYEVPARKGMTVLEALFYIQDNYDSSLAFRYSCRGSICGSCGMTIDKYPQLACNTQLADIKNINKPPKIPELIFGDVPNWDQDNEILIEPLPNMEVKRDLIVDMHYFWKFYEEVKPYFTEEWNDKAPESKQSPNDAKEIEHLVYCILCGLCWTCPVNAENKNYLGPTQLAKAYRFIADTRLSETHQKEILERVSKEDGVPACEKYFICNIVCPKDVRPGGAIHKTRKKWDIK